MKLIDILQRLARRLYEDKVQPCTIVCLIGINMNVIVFEMSGDHRSSTIVGLAFIEMGRRH